MSQATGEPAKSQLAKEWKGLPMSAKHPHDGLSTIDLQQAAALAGGDFTADPEMGMRRAPEPPRDYAEVGVKQPGRSFGDRLFNLFAKFGM